MLTQRRKGAKQQMALCVRAATAFLCASVPMREFFCVAVYFLTAAIAKADDTPARSAPIEQSAMSWPLGRGNAMAEGVAKTSLPDQPDVVWKLTIDKGAFDGTPVIADGVVYIGDMDGKVYAWNLADGTERWTYKVESGFIAAPAIRGGLLFIGDI